MTGFRPCVLFSANTLPIVLHSVITFVLIGNVEGQEIKAVKRSGSTMVISTLKEIPKATESCSQTECEWWERLRRTAIDLRQKGDQKSVGKFVAVLVEGLEKSYRVPIENHLPQLLTHSKPARPDPKKDGKVVLLIEYRADGSVGEVKIRQGLRADIDKNCIQAMRQNIFLPAVKDRTFVTKWTEGVCGFGSGAKINDSQTKEIVQ